ncbi:MAG TPA: 50S ribosomal protein L18 [bacterium]|nr:50S ribosomal protein L18 [bacterium]
MYHIKSRKTNREKRRLSIRNKIYGTFETPRLSVFRSNKDIYAQIIDDEKSGTIVEFSSKKLKSAKGTTKTQKSFEVGKEISKLALEKGIKSVVFDRGGYRYHGRVKAVAEGAREGGLKL